MVDGGMSRSHKFCVLGHETFWLGPKFGEGRRIWILALLEKWREILIA